MNYKIEKFFFRFLSIYLSSSILFFFVILSELGLGGFLSGLLPMTMGLLVFVFYFISGVRLFHSPSSKLNITLAQIALIMQAFQFEIFGLVFKNYYGPYLGIGFTDSPEDIFLIKSYWIAFGTINGYLHSTEIFVFLNLVPIFLLIILMYYTWKNEREEKRNRQLMKQF